MKMAVCEDSITDRNLLKSLIPNVISQLNLSMETDYFHSGEELVAAVQSGNAYTLILLDIYMQALNGMQTAQKVRQMLPDVQIAFLTTSREFALDAFDLNALHYLVKPITPVKLKECLERLCDRIRIPLQMIDIKSEFSTYSFPLMHIQKIVSYNKGIDIYLRDKANPEHIPISFANAEEQLDPAFFLLISRGIAVQMSYILCMDNKVCRLKDGSEILISRNRQKEIRKKYNDYLFGM